jgi:hypothetical protein
MVASTVLLPMLFLPTLLVGVAAASKPNFLILFADE